VDIHTHLLETRKHKIEVRILERVTLQVEKVVKAKEKQTPKVPALRLEESKEPLVVIAEADQFASTTICRSAIKLRLGAHAKRAGTFASKQIVSRVTSFALHTKRRCRAKQTIDLT